MERELAFHRLAFGAPARPARTRSLRCAAVRGSRSCMLNLASAEARINDLRADGGACRQIHPAPAAASSATVATIVAIADRSMPSVDSTEPRTSVTGPSCPISRSGARGGRRYRRNALCPAAAAAAADEHHDCEGDEREGYEDQHHAAGVAHRRGHLDRRRLAGDARIADASGMFTTTFTDRTKVTHLLEQRRADRVPTSTCWPVRAATSSGSAPMPVWMAARSTSPVTREVGAQQPATVLGAHVAQRSVRPTDLTDDARDLVWRRVRLRQLEHGGTVGRAHPPADLPTTVREIRQAHTVLELGTTRLGRAPPVHRAAPRRTRHRCRRPPCRS